MKYSFTSLFIGILIYACQSKQDLLPNSVGKPGEIIVVIEKQIWNSEVGKALKNSLMQDYPALPQDEPTFLLYPIPLQNFNDIFQSNRNIIKISFNPNSDSTYIRKANDRWAKPQLILEFVAKDIKTMTKLIQSNSSQLKKIILFEELKRLKQVYVKFKEKKLISAVHKFGIDLIIPKGYKLNLDTTNFMWISLETPHTSQGLFIYSVPYNDSSIFNQNKAIAIRDSVLKKYIPGPLQGTYMTTEHNYPLLENRFKLNGKFCYEIRGLWRVENDFMGGPFVNLASVVNNNRVVFVEGYVYAPKDDKKTYIWQLEAILFSLTHL